MAPLVWRSLADHHHADEGASLVMALGVLLLPVGIILPLVWVL